MNLPTYLSVCKKVLYKETQQDIYNDASYESNELLPTPLDEFIYNEEIFSQSPNGEFREGLSNLINYIQEEQHKEYIEHIESWEFTLNKLLRRTYYFVIVLPFIFIIAFLVCSYLPTLQ